MKAAVATAVLSGTDQRILEGVDVKAFAAMGFGFELSTVHGYPHILISFMYDEQRDFFTESLKYWPQTALGDSGAFTVWTKGEVVDIVAYKDWALAYQEEIEGFLAITLDVIPGKLDGGAPTDSERRKAMREGMENSDYLRGQGVRIMEVFHWHEPMEQLRVLLDRRRPGEIVGVGGLAGRGSITEKRAFCNEVWATVKDYIGGDWSRCPPVHGLGISPDSPLAALWPWWSIDSSSWAAPAKFGRHVSKDGKRGGRDSRVSNTDVRRLYLKRSLEGWNRKELYLTKLWYDRGVRFALDPVPA